MVLADSSSEDEVTDPLPHVSSPRTPRLVRPPLVVAASSSAPLASPAPSAQAKLHKDVRRTADGTLYIPKAAAAVRQALPPLLLPLERVDLGAQRLDGQLDFELLAKEKVLRLVQRGGKGKATSPALQLRHDQLRSAEVNVNRLNERGGSDVTLTFGAVVEDELLTLQCTVDTRVSSDFKPFELERVKSSLNSWAGQVPFPASITLIQALAVPSADSQAPRPQPPPPYFDAQNPATWCPIYPTREELNKLEAERRALLPAVSPQGQSRARRADSMEYDPMWGEAGPSDGTTGARGGKRRRSAVAPGSMRVPDSDEDDGVWEPAQANGGGVVQLNGQVNGEHAAPAPSKRVKKQRSLAALNGATLAQPKSGSSSSKPTVATVHAQVEALLARVNRLEAEAAKVPALEARLAQLEAERAPRVEPGEA